MAAIAAVGLGSVGTNEGGGKKKRKREANSGTAASVPAGPAAPASAAVGGVVQAAGSAEKKTKTAKSYAGAPAVPASAAASCVMQAAGSATKKPETAKSYAGADNPTDDMSTDADVDADVVAAAENAAVCVGAENAADAGSAADDNAEDSNAADVHDDVHVDVHADVHADADDDTAATKSCVSASAPGAADEACNPAQVVIFSEALKEAQQLEAALLLHPVWGDRLLSGEKTAELRSSRCVSHLGKRVGVVKTGSKGFLVGSVKFTRSEHLDCAGLVLLNEQHRFPADGRFPMVDKEALWKAVTSEGGRKWKQVYAWHVVEAHRYAEPVPFKNQTSQQTWINMKNMDI